jgi:hypothetical protein
VPTPTLHARPHHPPSRDFAAKGAVRLRFYLATGPSARHRVDLGPMAKGSAQTFTLLGRADIKKLRYAISWCVAVDEPIAQPSSVDRAQPSLNSGVPVPVST